MPLAVHGDDRGSFRETFRREWIPGAPEMVQSNLSVSLGGTIRGLHFHREQTDYWCVLSGRAFVGLLDLRTGSPTRGRTLELRIDPEVEPVGLYLPPGVAHGFCAETGAQLQYLVDRPYTGKDEFGLAWDDPDAAIAWPVADPILSERDRSNPPLARALELAPPYRG